MKNHEESNIQIMCVKYFRYAHPSLASLLFSVPNGGRRDKVTASIMKAEGVVAGVADLLLFVARGGYHGLCIEMKNEKGRQQDSQKEWQRKVQEQGYKYVVCRSLDSFMEEVEGYLRNI